MAKIRALQYRLLLRHLLTVESFSPEDPADFSIKDPKVLKLLVEDFQDVKILDKQGVVNHVLLAKIMEAIYDPDFIPQLFDVWDFPIDLVISGGPDERKDNVLEQRLNSGVRGKAFTNRPMTPSQSASGAFHLSAVGNHAGDDPRGRTQFLIRAIKIFEHTGTVVGQWVPLTTEEIAKIIGIFARDTISVLRIWARHGLVETKKGGKGKNRKPIINAIRFLVDPRGFVPASRKLRVSPQSIASNNGCQKPTRKRFSSAISFFEAAEATVGSPIEFDIVRFTELMGGISKKRVDQALSNWENAGLINVRVRIPEGGGQLEIQDVAFCYDPHFFSRGDVYVSGKETINELNGGKKEG